MDKKLRRRWENKLGFDDIETDIPTNRGVEGDSKESYITLDALTLLMTLYADGVIDDIDRKNNVDYTIVNILNEVEKYDKMNKEDKCLSSQYALEALSLNSKIAKGANDALINILKVNNNLQNNHTPYFDTEYTVNIIGDLEKYDSCLDEIYNAINNIDFYVPIEKKMSDKYSLLFDDYDPDTLD